METYGKNVHTFQIEAVQQLGLRFLVAHEIEKAKENISHKRKHGNLGDSSDKFSECQFHSSFFYVRAS